MPDAPNPVVDKLLLAKDLRRLREERQLTQQQVADELKWPRERVGRIETATASVTDEDLARLLSFYGVVDEDQVAEYGRRATAARRPGWNEYKGLLPSRYLTYLGFEEVASTMRQYHLSLVPGLLQTPEYMRDVLSRVNEVAPRDVRRLVEARTRRQGLLTAERRPIFRIIIDEAILHRQVGSTRVWREQLEHLRDLNSLDGVNLMVLPFRAGPHPGLKGAFNLLTFDDAPYEDLLYIENSEGDRIDRDDEDVVAEYLHIFDELEARSLDGEQFDRRVKEVGESFT